MLLVATLLTSSCIGDTALHKHQHISKDGWSRNDTMLFELHEIKKDGLYAASTEIRTYTSFPYKELWVVREMSLQAPFKLHKDTICIKTNGSGLSADGKGVTINSFAHTDSTQTFHKGQSGNIKLYHVMSRETLPHILDVGLKIQHIR